MREKHGHTVMRTDETTTTTKTSQDTFSVISELRSRAAYSIPNNIKEVASSRRVNKKEDLL